MNLPRFSAFQLSEGQWYRVVAEFKDFDGRIYPVGERWRFQSQNFFPYDAGLTLFIEDERGPRSIRLQDYAEEQGKIIDSFSDYVVADKNA